MRAANAGAVAAVGACGLIAIISIAGPLAPSAGPVAPTYKTLTEVEPRTSLSDASTPGDANSVYRITQPGSYYLTGNLTGASGKRGIEIASSNVTVDLGGFRVSGPTDALEAIASEGSLSAVTIEHGTITGWAQGGVILPVGEACVVRDVLLHNVSGSYSVRVGSSGLLERVRVTAGSGGAGATNTALRMGSLGTVRHCEVNTATPCTGIWVDVGSSVSECTVNTALSGGIGAPNGNATITNCTVINPGTFGIYVGSYCVVRNNHVTYVLDGPGIQVNGPRTRVEGNNVAFCQTGYFVGGSGVILMRNSAASNTTNYNLAAGNFGQFITPVVIPGISGSSGGVALGGDSNANFSY